MFVFLRIEEKKAFFCHYGAKNAFFEFKNWAEGETEIH
jgi:hypothetical protein